MKDTGTKKDYALKVYDEKKTNVGFGSLVEIDILFRFCSPYLLSGIKFYPSTSVDIKPAVLLPLKNGTASDLLTKPLITKRKFLRDIALGIQHLHSQNVVHGDLKLVNFLHFQDLRGELAGCLADFNLCVFVDDIRQQFQTKKLYYTYTHRAPEAHATPHHISGASDIWALGICFVELLSGHDFYKDVFRGFETEGYLRQIQRLMGNPNLARGWLNTLLPKQPEIIELILSMLQIKPEDRLTINQVVKLINIDPVPSEEKFTIIHVVNPERVLTRTDASIKTLITAFDSWCSDITDGLKYFFLGLDILIRASYFICDSDEFVKACYVMALNYYDGPVAFDSQHHIIDTIIYTIIDKFDGKIYRDNIYTVCENSNQMRICLDFKNWSQYLETDLKEYVRQLPPILGEPISKQVTIKEFFASFSEIKV